MFQTQRPWTASYDTLIKNIRLLLSAALLCIAPSLAYSDSQQQTNSAPTAVVSGDFVYMQEGDGSLLQYHVSKVDYQGTAAWLVSWQCEQLTAKHYLRISDGKPLYVKRINHVLNRTVEIMYSQDAKSPTLYRKRSADELVERKIWTADLQDLGTLPQMLVRTVQSSIATDKKKITFSAINYDDGKVYQLVAKHKGFRRIATDDGNMRCAIYDVKLDSWLSSFVSKTRLLIPLQQGSSNFVTYNGPGLDSVGDAWSLRLIGKGSSLAMVTTTSQ